MCFGFSGLCKKIIRYLSLIDPGYTPIMGQFMLETNKSFMALNKMDLDDGKISRVEFLSGLKEGVQVCYLINIYNV